MRALAQGTPLIVSTGGSLAEVVDSGEVGMTFAEDDQAQLSACLDEMLNLEDPRAIYGGNARELGRRQFDPHVIARETIELYGRVAARCRPGR
jgi:glycosyltransferase involved in cell wall biosynthesis